MVVFMRRIFAFVICISILSACGQNTDNVFDAPVKRGSAKIINTLDGEIVNIVEDKPNVITDIFVVDSVLLLKGKKQDSPYMIYVYSLQDNSYLGNYVAKGRGPNELLSPQFNGFVKKNDQLYLFDLNLCASYLFDYRKSVETNNTVLSKLVKLPARTLYAYPMDKGHIAIVPEEDDYVCEILDENGKQIKEFSLYPHVSGMQYFSELSSSFVVNQKQKKLAIAMCRVPQVNILNLDSGDKVTTAVSPEYMEWNKLINEDMTKSRDYYSSSTQSSKYFMALYRGGLTTKEQMDGTKNLHLHVFDWDGNFIYDISLSERLRAIALDESSKTLYGVDTFDNIYKYDMSGVL